MRTACLVAILVGAIGCHPEPAPVAHPAPTTPPGPPRDVSCVKVREHLDPLLAPTFGKDPDKLRRVGHTFTKRCLEDAWSLDVRTCLADTHVLDDDRRCFERLPAEHRTKFEAAFAAAAKDPEVPPPGSLPASCVAYRAATEKLLTCDKLKAAGNAIRDTFEDTWKQWQALPDADKKNLDDGCRAALQGVEETFRQACTP